MLCRPAARTRGARAVVVRRGTGLRCRPHRRCRVLPDQRLRDSLQHAAARAGAHRPLRDQALLPYLPRVLAVGAGGRVRNILVVGAAFRRRRVPDQPDALGGLIWRTQRARRVLDLADRTGVLRAVHHPAADPLAARRHPHRPARGNACGRPCPGYRAGVERGAAVAPVAVGHFLRLASVFDAVRHAVPAVLVRAWRRPRLARQATRRGAFRVSPVDFSDLRERGSRDAAELSRVGRTGRGDVPARHHGIASADAVDRLARHDQLLDLPFSPRVYYPLFWWLMQQPVGSAWRQLHLGAYLAVNTVLVVALATVVYRLVERPGIALGHRLASRWSRDERAPRLRATPLAD